jgi:beta-lactam-binding protein with PASTA domain
VHVDYSKRSPVAAKPGHVIYQMPGAGNTMHRGDTVAIVVYRP